jgi:hypothetical protein
MKTLLIAGLAALTFAGAAHAETPRKSGPTPGPHSGERASIPFTRFGNLYDFEAADDGEGIYLQDAHRDWYYASLFGPCTDLPFATRIGVVNWGFDTVDDSSTILVGHDRCRIDQLVHSGPPPKRVKKAKKG